MKVWIHKNEQGIGKYLQPDTEIYYIEETETSSNSIILLRSDDINTLKVLGGGDGSTQ